MNITDMPWGNTTAHSTSPDNSAPTDDKLGVAKGIGGGGAAEDGNVPVVGLGTPVFPSIHGTAIASLFISIVASIIVLVIMLLKKRGSSPETVNRNFWKRPIGERLVVYLAVGDLLFSITHLVDHALMLVLANNLPPRLCTTIAFFMLSFYYSPGVIALFTAINAFVMVVLRRTLHLGQYDWRILLVAFVLPSAFMVVGASFGFLGASGIACSFYFGSPEGRLVGQLFSISMVLSFIIDISCYLLVWMKIRSVAAASVKASIPSTSAQPSSGLSNKYHNSAKVMLIFVLAYLGQNWSVAIYYTWSFFTLPPLVMVYLVVTFVNMGGVFNALAYTVLRQRYQSVEPATLNSTRCTENKA